MTADLTERATVALLFTCAALLALAVCASVLAAAIRDYQTARRLRRLRGTTSRRWRYKVRS